MIKVILQPQVLLEMKHKNDYVVELGGVISASEKHMLGLLSSQVGHHRITVIGLLPWQSV